MVFNRSMKLARLQGFDTPICTKSEAPQYLLPPINEVNLFNEGLPLCWNVSEQKDHSNFNHLTKKVSAVICLNNLYHCSKAVAGLTLKPCVPDHISPPHNQRRMLWHWAEVSIWHLLYRPKQTEENTQDVTTVRDRLLRTTSYLLYLSRALTAMSYF